MRIFAVVLSLCFVGISNAETIVVTGDGNTVLVNIYLPNIMNNGYTVKGVTTNFITAKDYDLRGYDDRVLAEHPDTVFFMLGMTNVLDNNPETQVQTLFDFVDRTPKILEAYHNAGAKVVVGSILPIAYSELNWKIDSQYNPFLKSVAEQNGYIYFDGNALIKSQFNWQSLYTPSDMFLDTYGSQLLAQNVKTAIMQQSPVPEPTTTTMLIGLLCLLMVGSLITIRKNRNSSHRLNQTV